MLQLAQEGGSLDLLQEGGRVRALLATLPQPMAPGTEPLRAILLHHEAGAEAWLAQRVAALAPGWSGPAWIQLVPDAHGLRRQLGALGFGIQSVALCGPVDRALGRLVAGRNPPRQIPGLTLAPLAATHVDGILDLYRAVFSAEPRFCAFGAEPGWLAFQRARLLESTGDPLRLVLLEGQEVVGFLSGHRREDVHTPPQSVGMDLLLLPRHRGRGIARIAYRRILEVAHAEGIPWVKGTSGQPAVIKLALEMGRVVTAVHLGQGHPFPEGWFKLALG